jgi:carbonic anhydrase
MCDHHPTDISRRGFAGMAALGAGLSLLPLRAAAQTLAAPTVLCVTCIDYRYVNKAVSFFNQPDIAGPDNYDIVALAGASLAAYNPWAFPSESAGFWEQVAAARALHTGITRIVLLDHMTCGAYKVQFANLPPYDEKLKHIEVARTVGPILGAKGLPAKIFLAESPTSDPIPIWLSP